MCTLAQGAPAHIRALLWAMASQPKSKAVEEYRRQIATYIRAVQAATGWKNVETGKMAGELSYTTIGRAKKGEHTMGFPALMALEAASRVPIPDALRGAAIAAQQPPAFSDAPSAEEIRQVAADLQKKSPEYQRALLAELQRSLAKAD